MRKYQLAILVKANDATKKKTLEGVKEMLKGTKIEKEDDLGERELAYSINRETKGVYTNFLFDTESLPAGFEKKLYADENVLRFLLLKQ